MTEPKFQIGDVVAVFCMEDGVVIAYPQTEIIDREFVNRDEIVEGMDGAELVSDRDVWTYEVAAEIGALYAEDCIRKINPDTEYLDQPESVEQPA